MHKSGKESVKVKEEAQKNETGRFRGEKKITWTIHKGTRTKSEEYFGRNAEWCLFLLRTS